MSFSKWLAISKIRVSFAQASVEMPFFGVGIIKGFPEGIVIKRKKSSVFLSSPQRLVTSQIPCTLL